MTKVRLEFDEVTIYRPKKRWYLYFVVMIEHPTDKNKMILTTLPEEPIKLSKRHENSFQFDTDDFGSEGLYVFSRNLPKDKELNVHVYLRHSRKKTRNLGGILQDIDKGIGKDSFDLVEDIVGTTKPWLSIAKKAVPLVGRILKSIPDRDFGFLSAFEKFGKEFDETYEIDRAKDFTGDASLVYSWSIDD